jgi:SM-20-related protein
MFIGHESKDVLPVAGRLVCFRSDLLEHEVLPATRERLSLTGWLIDKIG